MILSRTTALVALASGVYAQSQYTSTGTAAVAKAAATALTLSPTSSVAGLTFDRFVQIWLENENYSAAIKDSEWPMLWDLNILHIANLKFSKPRLSSVSRHHTHQLFCYHPSLSGKTTQALVKYSSYSRGDRSQTMLPPLVVAPSGSLMTAHTISLRAPRPSSTCWKTLVSAGACIRRICLILALRQIIPTKNLVQTTTCASTSKSPNTNIVRGYSVTNKPFSKSSNELQLGDIEYRPSC